MSTKFQQASTSYIVSQQITMGVPDSPIDTINNSEWQQSSDSSQKAENRLQQGGYDNKSPMLGSHQPTLNKPKRKAHMHVQHPRQQVLKHNQQESTYIQQDTKWNEILELLKQVVSERNHVHQVIPSKQVPQLQHQQGINKVQQPINIANVGTGSSPALTHVNT